MKYSWIMLLYVVVLSVSLSDAMTLSGSWELVQAKESKAKLLKTGSIVTLSGDVVIRHDNDEYRADVVVFYEKEQLVLLTGNVRVTRSDASVRADKCEYNGSRDTAIFTGNVVITQTNATITGKRALIRTLTSDIEVTGDVYFTQQEYSGLSEYFYYNDALQTIFLEGIPYIIFDHNYAGGDNMMIFLNEKSEITRAEINLHADLYWHKNDQEVELKSEKMVIYFTEGNEPKYADLFRDVRVYMYEKEFIQTIQGSVMRADFSKNSIGTVVVKGNVSGKREKRESTDEKNKSSEG